MARTDVVYIKQLVDVMTYIIGRYSKNSKFKIILVVSINLLLCIRVWNFRWWSMGSVAIS